jgi:hypothetical protein
MLLRDYFAEVRTCARAIRQDNEDMQGEMPFFHMLEKCHRPHWVYPYQKNIGNDEDNRARSYRRLHG